MDVRSIWSFRKVSKKLMGFRKVGQTQFKKEQQQQNSGTLVTKQILILAKQM